MSCPAVGDQTKPGNALLGRLQKIGALPADGCREAAHFRDRFSSALEQLRTLVHGVTGAVFTASLLVGEKGEDNVPLGLPSGSGQIPHDGQDHGIHVLHVNGTAAPDESILQFRAEGIHGPLIAQCGNNVKVSVYYQRTG